MRLTGPKGTSTVHLQSQTPRISMAGIVNYHHTIAVIALQRLGTPRTGLREIRRADGNLGTQGTGGINQRERL